MPPRPVMRPFERMGIDLLEIGNSKSQYRYILVMIDHATRYCEVAPLISVDSQVVAELLYTRIFERYGPINVIIHDGGKEFTAAKLSDIVDGLYAIMGARDVTSSPYHPQTNGTTERVNSTLAAILRALTENHAEDWPEYLQACAYVYNTTHQSAVGTSPYFLLYGRYPTDQVDQWVSAALGLHDTPINEKEWMERLDEARYLATEKTRKMQETNATRLDTRRKDGARLQEGDFVVWKPEKKDERKRKLQWYGFPTMRIAEIRGNQLMLANPDDDSLQLANINDVIPLEANPPYFVFNLYDSLRAMLRMKRHAPVPPPRYSDLEVPIADARAGPPRKPLPALPESVGSRSPMVFSPLAVEVAPDVPAIDAVVPATPITPRSILRRPETSPLPKREVHFDHEMRANRIIRAEKAPRKVGNKSQVQWKVQFGYEGYPDSPLESSKWHWIDDVTDADRWQWLETFKATRAAKDQQVRKKHRARRNLDARLEKEVAAEARALGKVRAHRRGGDDMPPH